MYCIMCYNVPLSNVELTTKNIILHGLSLFNSWQIKGVSTNQLLCFFLLFWAFSNAEKVNKCGSVFAPLCVWVLRMVKGHFQRIFSSTWTNIKTHTHTYTHTHSHTHTHTQLWYSRSKWKQNVCSCLFCNYQKGISLLVAKS